MDGSCFEASNWRMLHYFPNVSPCAAAADDELCQFQLRVRLNERDAHELERKRESEMSEMEEDGKDFKVRDRGCFIPKFSEALWQSVIIHNYK